MKQVKHSVKDISNTNATSKTGEYVCDERNYGDTAEVRPSSMPKSNMAAASPRSAHADRRKGNATVHATDRKPAVLTCMSDSSSVGNLFDHDRTSTSENTECKSRVKHVRNKRRQDHGKHVK